MHDYHTHTSFSDDCNVPMDEMIQAAIRLGIKEMAITDHYDPGYVDPDYPFLLDFKGYHAALLDAEKRYNNQIKIIKGIEVGIMDSQLSECTQTVKDFPYDFVLGSFHSLREMPIYGQDYTQINEPAMLEDFYTYVYNCLKTYKDYDVIAHFSIIDRYTTKLYDYAPYMDIIDETLKLIIYDGKGLEINTSNFRYQLGVWLPREEILRRYKELGGEILTFGSDAHQPDGFLDHFDEARELARNIGFKYFTTYDKRKPNFLKL